MTTDQITRLRAVVAGLQGAHPRVINTLSDIYGSQAVPSAVFRDDLAALLAQAGAPED